jgi:hypothetical protein
MKLICPKNWHQQVLLSLVYLGFLRAWKSLGVDFILKVATI